MEDPQQNSDSPNVVKHHRAIEQTLFACDTAKTFGFWCTGVVLLSGIDQYLKLWARELLEADGQSVVLVWPNILELKLLCNAGAAFSMLQGQKILLTGIGLIAIFVFMSLGWEACKNGDRLGRFATMALMAGTVGNAIDRVIYGCVTDIFDLLILPGDFPIFNFADVLINLGVAVMIAKIFLSNRKS